MRGRLERALDEQTERPLTVVCAPAGYGKTTALATWLARRKRPFAWVSLDTADDDPRRLVAHLLAVLRHHRPAAASAERSLGDGEDLIDTVIPLAGAAIDTNGDDGLVIVLDDFDAVTAPAGKSKAFRLTARALRGTTGTKVNRATASSPDARTKRAKRTVRVAGSPVKAGGVTG